VKIHIALLFRREQPKPFPTIYVFAYAQVNF